MARGVAVIDRSGDDGRYACPARLVARSRAPWTTSGMVLVTRTGRAGRRHVAPPRTRTRIEELFDGFDLLPPDVVDVARWRPEETDSAAWPALSGWYGGVGVLARE